MVYRFDDFALHRDTRQLTEDGGEIHVSPKSFELLMGASCQPPTRSPRPKRAQAHLAVDPGFIAERSITVTIRGPRDQLARIARPVLVLQLLDISRSTAADGQHL